MIEKYRRLRQLGRVRPGDGSPVPEYRLWQVSRSLFLLDVPRPEGGLEHPGPADSATSDVLSVFSRERSIAPGDGVPARHTPPRPSPW
jgi:hypothetical protein